MKPVSKHIFGLVISAYSVAALSFICMILRDFLILKFSEPELSKVFFNMIYISSISSMICINFITLHSKAPKKIHVILLSIISLGVSVLLVKNEVDLVGGEYKKFLILSMIMVILWIFGAIIARGVLANGSIFLARSRELIASVVFMFIYIFMDDILTALVLSIFIATLLFLFLARNNCNFSFFNNTHDKNEFNFLLKLFLTNISPLLFMFWALKSNAFTGYLWGVDSTLITRVSVYAYQALSIGVFVIIPLTKKFNMHFIKVQTLVLMMPLLTLLSFGCMFLDQELQLVFVPLSLIVLHYSNIFYLQLQNQETK